MKRLFISLTLAGLTVAGALAAPIGWPANSATSDNIFSVAANPAGLGIERDGEFLFNWRVNDAFPDNRNEYSFLISGDGIGFGLYEVYSPVRDDIVRQYQLSGGGHLGGGFYLGSRINWWARFPDQQPEWDAGLLYRPFRFISLGVTAANLLETNDGYRAFRPGIAIRPIWGSSRLTLSASTSLTKTATTDYGDEMPYWLQVEVEPLPGMILAGNWESESETIGIAASFGTDFASVFASQNLVDEDEASLRSIGLHLTSEKKRSLTDVVVQEHSEFIEIKLEGGLPYFSTPRGFFGKRGASVRQLLDFLEELTEEQDAAGIFLHLRGPALGGTGTHEVAEALQAYRDAGGQVYTFLEYGGLGAYYLAAHTDKIFMPQTSGVSLQGISVESMFYSGLLDKVGLEMEVIAAGKYKSALEQFNRTGFSEPAREAIDAVIVDILADYTAGIATARGLSVVETRTLIADGPYNFKRALAAGLVDGSLYYHDREELLEELSGLEEISLVCWCEHDKTPLWDYTWGVEPEPKQIAVIRAEGVVVNQDKPKRSMFGGSPQVTYQVADLLKKAREDNQVAATILWINSPGGAVLASDVIWREMKKYHTDDFDKPLIAVMADVAGSGGYYIACAADTIIAAPTTITGSIGVISGKPNTWQLFDKIGVSIDTMHYTNHPSVNSVYYPYTEEDHQLVEDVIMDIYDIFLDRVVDGRGMERKAVHAVAQGRIWSGEDAQANGLIDLLGDLDTGFEVARHLAGDDTVEYELVEYEPPREKFKFSLGLGISSDMPAGLEQLLAEYERFEEIATGKPLLLMPVKIGIE